jgi:hypothetical protein
VTSFFQLLVLRRARAAWGGSPAIHIVNVAQQHKNITKEGAEALHEDEEAAKRGGDTSSSGGGGGGGGSSAAANKAAATAVNQKR